MDKGHAGFRPNEAGEGIEIEAELTAPPQPAKQPGKAERLPGKAGGLHGNLVVGLAGAFGRQVIRRFVNLIFPLSQIHQVLATI